MFSNHGPQKAEMCVSQDGFKISVHNAELYYYVCHSFVDDDRDERKSMHAHGDITLSRHADKSWHLSVEAKVEGIPGGIGGSLWNGELYKREGTVTFSQATEKTIKCAMDLDYYTPLESGMINYANCVPESRAFIRLENIAPMAVKKNRLIFSVLGNSLTVRNVDGSAAFDINNELRVTEKPEGGFDLRKLETLEIVRQRAEDLFSIKRTVSLTKARLSA